MCRRIQRPRRCALEGRPDLISNPPAPADMARRRQRIVWVRFLRRTLPVTAAVLMAGVVGQVIWRAVAVVVAPEAQASGTAVQMENPSFSGQSPDGSTYMLTARSGLRDAADAARILLDMPTVIMSHGADPGTRTTSKTGVFREDDHTLELKGDVRVDNGAGYKFAFQDAVIDTTTGKVSGQGVQGQGPTGQVRSDRYTVYDKGERMVFEGGVHGRIEGR
jgi:lipopolysaccharide export system protein LptC